MNEGQMRYYCECKPGWNGQYCDVPNPTLTCGTQEMVVLIDKRMIVGNDLDKSAHLIQFGDGDYDENSKCVAKDDGDHYRLNITSPFTENCGTTSSRSAEGDYLFHNIVQWKKVYEGQEGEAPIQRKIKLVDFKCNYEDEYLLHLKPMKPAESVIERKIEKGEFKVAMSLWKNSDFENDINGRYDSNPIIRVGQEVCVKMSLENKLEMDNLVLTAANCWASATETPASDEEKHQIIANKCKADDDYTTVIKQNGVGDDVKFCFKLYKWQQAMDNLYIQCKVSICDDSIMFDGSSQCVCAPKTFKINSWFYPNYYGSQMDAMADYSDYYDYGLDLVGDDASDGQSFYYDYFQPYEFEGGEKRRRRRSAESEEEGTEDSEDATDSLPTRGEDYDGSQIAAQSKRRKRLEFVGTFKDAETGELKLPPGIKADPKGDLLDVGYGPIKIRDAVDPTAVQEALAEVEVIAIEDTGEWFETPESADNVVLVAVGGSLVFAMIVLGIVIGVYVQFRNQANQKAQKSFEEQHKVREFYQGVLKTGKQQQQNNEHKTQPAFLKVAEME